MDAARSEPEADRFVVAEDHDLLSVDHCVIAAASDFAFEGGCPHDQLEIPKRAAHHVTFARGLGIEDPLHPEIGREKARHVIHALRLPNPG